MFTTLCPCVGPLQCQPVEVALFSEDQLFRVVVSSNHPPEFLMILLILFDSRLHDLSQCGGECVSPAEKKDRLFHHVAFLLECASNSLN